MERTVNLRRDGEKRGGRVGRTKRRRRRRRRRGRRNADEKEGNAFTVYLRLIKITWFRERTCERAFLQNGRFTRNRVSPLRWPSEWRDYRCLSEFDVFTEQQFQLPRRIASRGVAVNARDKHGIGLPRENAGFLSPGKIEILLSMVTIRPQAVLTV